MRIALLVDRASLTSRSPSEDLRKTIAAVTRALQHNDHMVILATLPDLHRTHPDMVFNLCEGIDGNAQREPDAVEAVTRMGYTITGNSARTLRLALDKIRTKTLLRRAGLRTPHTCNRPDARLHFPLIIKPRREDASIGVDRGSVVWSWSEAKQRLSHLKCEAIVEEFIDGREFNVSILGEMVLAISEIDFSRMPRRSPHIVTYSAKWLPQSAEYRGTRPVCPAQVSPTLGKALRRSALAAYRALDCTGAARIDLRTDRRNRVYVLEVNPNPDLAPGAGFARAARTHGWSYSELIARILRHARL